MFIELAEIRRKHRLLTAESEIIKWLTYNIQPAESRVSVQNYLKQSESRAKKASRKLDRFHDLVMDMAMQFAKAHQLGMRPKARPKGGGDPNPKNSKGTKNGPPKGGPPKDGPKRAGVEPPPPPRTGNKVKCVYCDGDHRAAAGPEAVTKAWLRNPIEEPAARSKRLLKLPEPKTHTNPSGPDGDARKDLMTGPSVLELNLKYVRAQQDRYKKSQPRTRQESGGRGSVAIC